MKKKKRRQFSDQAFAFAILGVFSFLFSLWIYFSSFRPASQQIAEIQNFKVATLHIYSLDIVGKRSRWKMRAEVDNQSLTIEGDAVSAILGHEPILKKELQPLLAQLPLTMQVLFNPKVEWPLAKIEAPKVFAEEQIQAAKDMLKYNLLFMGLVFTASAFLFFKKNYRS